MSGIPSLNRAFQNSSSSVNSDFPSFKVGDQVLVDGNYKAEIKYIGATSFRPGIWIGVELEEPAGKNSGTIQGIHYFDCKTNHGLFLQPSKLSLLRPADNLKSFEYDSSKESANSAPKPPIYSSETYESNEITSKERESQMREIARYKKRLEACERDLQKATSDLLATMENESHLSAENTSLRKSLVEKEIQMKTLYDGKTVNSLNREIEELRAENEKITRKLESLNEEYADQMDSLRSENNLLKREKNQRLSDVEKLKSSLSNKEVELAMVKAEKNVAESDANKTSTLQSENDSLKKRIDQLKSQLEEAAELKIAYESRMNLAFKSKEDEFSKLRIETEREHFKQIEELRLKVTSLEIDIEKRSSEKENLSALQSQNSQLLDVSQEKIYEFEKLVQDLNSQLSILSSENNDLTKSLHGQNLRLRDLADEVSSKQRICESMKIERDQSLAKLKEMESSLAEFKSLQNQISERENSEVLISQLRENSQMHQKANNELQHNLSHLQENLRESECHNNALTKKLEQMRKSRENVENQFFRSQAKCIIYKVILGEFEHQIAKYCEEVEELTNDQVESLTSLEVEKQKNDELVSQMEALEAKIIDLNNSLRAKQEKVKNLEYQVDLLSSEKESNRSGLEELNSKLHELQLVLNEKTAIVLKLTDDLKNNEASITHLQTQLSDLNQKYEVEIKRSSDLEFNLSQVKLKNLESLKTVRIETEKEFSREIIQLTTQLGELLDKVSTLEEENKALLKDIEALASENDRNQNSNVDVVDQLKSSLVKYQSLCEEKNVQVNILEEECSKYKSLLENAEFSIHNLRSKEDEVIHLKKVVSECENIIFSDKQAMENLKSNVLKLENDLNLALMEKNEQNNARLLSLEKELKNATSKSWDSERQLVDLRKKLDFLQEKYDILLDEKLQSEESFKRFVDSLNDPEKSNLSKKPLPSMASGVNMSEMDVSDYRIAELKSEVQSIDNLLLDSSQLANLNLLGGSIGLKNIPSIGKLVKELKLEALGEVLCSAHEDPSTLNDEKILVIVNEAAKNHIKEREELSQLLEKHISREAELENRIQRLTKTFDSELDLNELIEEDLKTNAKEAFCENCESYGHSTEKCDKINEMY